MTPTRPTRPTLPAVAALLTLLAALPAAAQEPRNEIGLHWTPAAMASDDRRSRGLGYDRDFGNGWSLGGTLGYGRVEAPTEGDGLYGVLRIRKRLGPLPGMPNLRPQLGLEYGGTTNLFDTSEIIGLFAGLHIALSPELAFTVDAWAGRLRFESGFLGSQTNETRRENVQNIRLGLVFRY